MILSLLRELGYVTTTGARLCYHNGQASNRPVRNPPAKKPNIFLRHPWSLHGFRKAKGDDLGKIGRAAAGLGVDARILFHEEGLRTQGFVCFFICSFVRFVHLFELAEHQDVCEPPSISRPVVWSQVSIKPSKNILSYLIFNF